MMHIEVLSPPKVTHRIFNSYDIFIVVDTFRASTSIATLLDSGAKTIYIVMNKIQALTLKRKISPSSILIGEENGLKIKGFDYGNRPSLFYDLDFRECEIIFTSTNGAKRILLCSKQKYVLVGGLVNLTSVSKEASILGKKEESDIYIIPAGYSKDETRYIEEDWITSVLLVRKIQELHPNILLKINDLFKKSNEIVQNKKSLEHQLSKNPNAKKLRKLGFEHDVYFASQIDKFSTVPMIKKFESLDDIAYAVVKEKKN